MSTMQRQAPSTLLLRAGLGGIAALAVLLLLAPTVVVVVARGRAPGGGGVAGLGEVVDPCRERLDAIGGPAVSRVPPRVLPGSGSVIRSSSGGRAAAPAREAERSLRR